MKKVINVDKQARLSLPRTIELVLSGVRFRLFRAAITVAIISLAVAFLTTMLGESVIARNVAIAINQETGPRKLLDHWVSRLGQPITPDLLTAQLANTTPDSSEMKEFAAWGNLTPEEATPLIAYAQEQLVYDAYFLSLNEGDLRSLVGRPRGAAIYDHLQDPSVLETFHTQRAFVKEEFPTSREEFDDFLNAWDAMTSLQFQIAEGQARATDEFSDALLSGLTVNQYLATSPDNLPELIDPMGFTISPNDAATIREQASLALDAEMTSQMLKAPMVKLKAKDWTGEESLAKVSSDGLFKYLSSKANAEKFITELDGLRDRFAKELDDEDVAKRLPEEEVRRLTQSRSFVENFPLSADRLVEVANWKLRETELSDIEAKVSLTTDMNSDSAFSSRTIALISVSFLVCMVGIINAMLMSVADRFREIATMKCLGATDGFIMTNFMLESAVQGVVGGVIGACLGAVLGIVRSWAAYGDMALHHLPGLSLLAAAALSFALGVILSVLAAVYPAFVAARLAPMEAMRIE